MRGLKNTVATLERLALVRGVLHGEVLGDQVVGKLCDGAIFDDGAAIHDVKVVGACFREV